MLRSTKSRLTTVIAAGALSVGFAVPAAAQVPSLPPLQGGLVNVNVSGNTVQVPIGVAANLCDINAAILARQKRGGGASCTATAETIASPGQGGGNGEGGGNGGGETSQPDGLVNVNVSGNTIQVPIGIAANICDVNAAILARQEREGGASCTADADASANRS